MDQMELSLTELNSIIQFAFRCDTNPIQTGLKQIRVFIGLLQWAQLDSRSKQDPPVIISQVSLLLFGFRFGGSFPRGSRMITDSPSSTC